MIGNRGKDKEYEKIRSRLRDGEEILLTVTQSKAILPATYFVTNERIITRDPSITGEGITSIQWVDVGDFSLKKRLFRAYIEFVIRSGSTVTLDNISRGDAEEMYRLIEKYVKRLREAANEQHAKEQAHTGQGEDKSASDPLAVLKMKLVNDEITEEEFEKKKKLLE
ncbi:hypothetical protein CENSYa_0610 [Cenarchaeum symbiosum A]|uniref:Uncharacterized protein n=1 Tax=Cenarchaeum symbiosum (strain A) TaxID=414004 RepID=A0RV76_CENSY|nr:hypothetical protein CENSYa_0610 [Cenarchaeum symbiosum A]